MKKEKKTSFENFNDSNIENEFLESLQKAEEEVVNNSRDHAIHNEPEIDDPAGLYLEPITEICNRIAREKILSPLQPEHNYRKYQRTKQSTRENIKELEAKKKALDHKSNITSRESEKKEAKCRGVIHKSKMYRFFSIAAIPITGADIFLSASALIAMGFSLLTSYVLGFAIGISAMFIADMTPSIMKSKKISKKRKVTYIVTVIGFLALILGVLGKYRAMSLDSIFSGSALYFLLINFLFLIVIGLISWKYKISDDERKLVELWSGIQRKLKKIRKQYEEMDQAKAEENEKYEKAEDSKNAVFTLGENLESRLNTAYHGFIRTYIHENKLHRSDRLTPKFFKNYKASPLKLYFNKNQHKKNESNNSSSTHHASNGVMHQK